MRRIPPRQYILFLGLLSSLGAALWVNGKEEDRAPVAATVIRESRTPSMAEAQPDLTRLSLERLNRRMPIMTDIDPFPAKSWFVPPPPAPPMPPPKPTAPPLPFQYIGKKEDANGGNLTVFLTKGNESFTVMAGEKFDGSYQFEGMDQDNLVILYLPLSVKQRLSIGLTE
jgi:hypothetical protein